MSIAWIAIMPVVVLTVALASVLIYFVAKNNKKDSHKTIDPKPTQNFDNYTKKEESKWENYLYYLFASTKKWYHL